MKKFLWLPLANYHSFSYKEHYESFGKNKVVLDEGNNLSVKYWVTYETCQSFCESTPECNSFVHCTMSEDNTGDCWIKDKVLDGTEPTRDDSNRNQCTSYYKTFSGKTSSNDFYNFSCIEKKRLDHTYCFNIFQIIISGSNKKIGGNSLCLYIMLIFTVINCFS